MKYIPPAKVTGTPLSECIAMISNSTKERYEKAPIMQTLEGQRIMGCRYIGSHNQLLKPIQGFVYCTIYAHDGPIIEEEKWRAAGRRVFEEVHKGERDHPTAARVEVFNDYTWVELDWDTLARKNTPLILITDPPPPRRHRPE